MKLIGTTSHYVTEEFDDWSIICLDIARISHKDSVDNIVRKGRYLGKIVL
jgi:formyltetrahydrofolate deformylase